MNIDTNILIYQVIPNDSIGYKKTCKVEALQVWSIFQF